MKNFALAFLVFIIWSFFGLWFYHWLQPDEVAMKVTTENPDEYLDTIVAESNQKNTQHQDKNALPVNSKTTIEYETAGLAVTTEKGDLVFSYPENISIKKNSAIINIPQSIQDFKYKLNNYLLEHPGIELVIVSKYSAEENIESPNYGVQRARQLKSLLVNTGISSQQIVIKPHITPMQFKSDNSNSNAFSLSLQPLDMVRLENVMNEIPETKIIYPTYSDAGILNSPILEVTLQEIKMMLQSNPNLFVTVVGHTDNVGNAIDNYERGLEFAKQIRWYLISRGKLDRTKVRAASEGESNAIASNNTEKGRDLNQRIEIKFNLE